MHQTADFARDHDLMIHTHLAETVDEERFCMEKTGFRPAGYMDSLGWMGSNSWYAHCVHMTDEEIRMMGERSAGVSHCPSSNMRLGSGIARIKEMLDSGVKVSLGVDGSASNDSGNMLNEIRNAMLISRLREEQFWLSARDVLRIATKGGANALGRQDIGELSVGKQADIVLFSLNHLEYAGSLSDPLAALVFSVRTNPVDYLIVNGKILINKGKSSHNEDQLISKHNILSEKMLNNAELNTGLKFR